MEAFALFDTGSHPSLLMVVLLNLVPRLDEAGVDVMDDGDAVILDILFGEDIFLDWMGE